MHTLRNDNDAVSPVIGVILMVAITVLLATTAAAFFLELGNDQGKSMTPNTAFEVSYEDETSDVITIEHTTGDNLKAKHLSVVIEDAGSGVDGRYPVESLTSYGPQSTISAGSTIRLDKSGDSLNVGSNIDFSSATVKLTWQGSGTSQSKILRKWSGPDA